MLTRSEDDTAKKVDSASVATACNAHDASLETVIVSTPEWAVQSACIGTSNLAPSSEVDATSAHLGQV